MGALPQWARSPANTLAESRTASYPQTATGRRAAQRGPATGSHMKIRPPRYKVWRVGHLVLTVLVLVVSRILNLPAPNDESFWSSVVTVTQKYGWWAILFGGLAGEGGTSWIKAKESSLMTNALNAILSEFREEVFGSEAGQHGDHRVTLFQYRRTCWRVMWQRAKWPRGGWLVPVARPGHTSQRSYAVFRAPDNPGKLEGIAGKAWGANSKTFEVFDLPDLSEARNSKKSPLVKGYANGSHISERWVRRRIKKKGLLARSIMGFTVERPDGTEWGVLVLDSKKPHINGQRIATEFRDLWKRSLRHMVADL